MVMVPHAGKMHFRHSDQQNSSGGGPRPPAWALQLRCSQGRAPPDMVCPPKQKILATPLPRMKQQGPQPRVLGKRRDRSHSDRLRRRCWGKGRTRRHNARGSRQNHAHQEWWHRPLYLGRRTAATRTATQLGVAAVLFPHKAVLFKVVGQRGAGSEHLV